MSRHGEKSPGLRHGFFFGGDQKAGGGGHSRRNPRHGLPDFRPGPHQLADNVVIETKEPPHARLWNQVYQRGA